MPAGERDLLRTNAQAITRLPFAAIRSLGYGYP
jgi:hypothetical protein